MKKELIIAGFGGQGVMFMGKMLAHSGMKEGLEVTWMPSYGPEMRGGTAHCTVKISTERIASPFCSHPDTLLVMNRPSLEKFQPRVRAGGSMYYNSSMIEQEISGQEIDVAAVPANKIAEELGNPRIANMVMLGAYIAREEIVDLVTINNSLAAVLPEEKHNLIDINLEALKRGYSLYTSLEKN